MATTVASTLKLFDAMTGPLKSITQSLNLVISAMQQMQNATNRNINVDRTLAAAKRQLSSAESAITQAINQSTAAQQKFNQAVKQGKKESDSLLKSLQGFAAAYLGIEGAKRFGEMTIGGAAEQQQFLDTFAARAGNDALGAAIYDQITKQALKYGQDVDKALSGSMAFMSNTLDPKQLAELNKLAMRLAKLNPAEGLEGAAFSMKELLSGDYTSIVERFNMGRSMIQNSDALKAGKAGDLDAFIKGMDELLNKQNMTEQAFEKMLDSPVAKWQKAVNTFKFNMAQAGKLGMEAFGPLIDTINKAFESGRFMTFFTVISTGLYVFSRLLSVVANAAMNVYDVVAAYWPEISAMLIAWASMYLPGLIMKLWAMIPPILAQAKAWLFANWPILLAVFAVGLFIFILRKLGVTTNQIVGFVAGIFSTLFAFLRNQIAFFWNTIVSVAEFLVNIFIDPVYAIKKLFYDMVENVAGYFGNMINGIISTLNSLIKVINKIPGVDVPLIPKLDTNGDWLKAIKPESDRNVVDLSKWRMEYKDLGEAFNTGFAKANFVDKMADVFNGFGIAGTVKAPNIDKVGEVGKIKDTVDISNEDLKMMRELAEMKNIQNFVTLTPTVSVTTGPIQNGYDVDTIIARIETALTEQIASSAKGVYG